MSNKEELLKNFFDAAEANDFSKVKSMVTDSFMFSGPVPEPLNKQGYMGFLKGNAVAFSEFKYNYENFQESGEMCNCRVTVSGKHTGELTVPGMDPIPATNKNFVLPSETVTATFEGEKISKLEADPHPEGGIKGIIKQLTS
ncbi:MAG: hypothetical protein HeimC3_51430 [Candidatus Heimdallarchaeota archaeon LC_3]|nr:MAG: hypothetical protein HeimC3_51430 [Candidatus Heimdallarchaeota archaeon LC_3]